MNHNPACYLATHGVHQSGSMPPCDGQLVRCHLIPKQVLRREVWNQREKLRPLVEQYGTCFPHALDQLLWAPGAYVMGCGGPHGSTGHHGMLDITRSLRLPFKALPQRTIDMAHIFGLDWYLQREYGDRPASPDGVDAGGRATAV